MLAYRHAFHAGNHADVLKHLILVHVLGHMNAKPKGWRYVDTHAGAGAYSLRSSSARRNAEHEQGIGRLWHRHDAPPAVRAYLDAVRAAGRAAAGIGPLAPLAPQATLRLTASASPQPAPASTVDGADASMRRVPSRRDTLARAREIVDVDPVAAERLRGSWGAAERAFADTVTEAVDFGRAGGDEVLDPMPAAETAEPSAAEVALDDLGAPSLYPGSPALAAAFRRPQDQLMLYELHPTDFRHLAEHWGRRHGAQVRRADGFEAWPAVWPPPSRRGVLLIDPSYELERDYLRVLQTVRAALSRFADGVVVVWIPQVSRLGARTLPRKLQAQAQAARRGWLHASLTVQATDAQGYGLAGSSVVVINPPHTLHGALAPALPWLREALTQIPRPASVLEQQLL